MKWKAKLDKAVHSAADNIRENVKKKNEEKKLQSNSANSNGASQEIHQDNTKNESSESLAGLLGDVQYLENTAKRVSSMYGLDDEIQENEEDTMDNGENLQ